MISNQQAKQILKYREIASLIDSKELQEKREDWLDKLNVINCNGNFKVFEMYHNAGYVRKSKTELYQFFNSSFNTRTKINFETCCESDKIIDREKSFELFIKIINNLIKKRYHFAVFYAEGQRSPHIRIYDFEELEELDEFRRIKAQISFWRRVVPFGFFQLIDTSVFQDDHPLQIEFGIHWKYFTPFKLLFEHVPCNT